MVLQEQESRQKFEREQREDTEKRWDALKRLNDDEMHGMREHHKVNND